MLLTQRNNLMYLVMPLAVFCYSMFALVICEACVIAHQNRNLSELSGVCSSTHYSKKHLFSPEPQNEDTSA